MNTGEKIATGVLVPLGIIGIAAGGYYIYYTQRREARRRQRRDDHWDNLESRERDNFRGRIMSGIRREGIRSRAEDARIEKAEEQRALLRNIDTSLFTEGGKRRTHRRRR